MSFDRAIILCDIAEQLIQKREFSAALTVLEEALGEATVYTPATGDEIGNRPSSYYEQEEPLYLAKFEVFFQIHNSLVGAGQDVRSSSMTYKFETREKYIKMAKEALGIDWRKKNIQRRV